MTTGYFLSSHPTQSHSQAQPQPVVAEMLPQWPSSAVLELPAKASQGAGTALPQASPLPAKQPRLSEQESSFPSPLDELPHCWARLQEAAMLLPIPALFSADNHVKPI